MKARWNAAERCACICAFLLSSQSKYHSAALIASFISERFSCSQVRCTDMTQIGLPSASVASFLHSSAFTGEPSEVRTRPSPRPLIRGKRPGSKKEAPSP